MQQRRQHFYQKKLQIAAFVQEGALNWQEMKFARKSTNWNLQGTEFATKGICKKWGG